MRGAVGVVVILLLAGVVLPMSAVGQPADYVLQRGPILRQGLPVSRRDLTDYLFAEYSGETGLVEVALTDPGVLSRLREAQGSIWEIDSCGAREYSHTLRYGRVYWIPRAQPDLLIGFNPETHMPQAGCAFLELLLSEMGTLRGQPDFRRDPFPALLPMPQ